MSALPHYLRLIRCHLADLGIASNEAEWRHALANLVAGLIVNPPGAPLDNPDLHLLVREAETAIKAGPPRGKRRSPIKERNATWMLRAVHAESIPEATRLLQWHYGLSAEAARKRATMLNARHGLGLRAGEAWGGKKRPPLSADAKRSRVITE